MCGVSRRRWCSRIPEKYRSCNEPTMSSVQCLREFVNERLTAAAEEIFGVFEKTIVEYEQEIDRQRRLLDIVWKPEIKLHRTELPQQHVCREEEVLPDQQLWNQERNSSVDQEDPEPPQFKEEQEQLCSSQEGEQLVVKQETDTFMWTPTNEDSDQSEAEPHSDQQLLSHSSPAAESQDQTGSQPVESGSARNAGTCDMPYVCNTCGKRFMQVAHLSAHLGTHTVERPCCCETCGKHFVGSGALSAHMRIHTREEESSYSCTTCGKKLSTMSMLIRHMRSHTKYSCIICKKSFIRRHSLKVHMRTHTGERPYACKICGCAFRYSNYLKGHLRTHTGEKTHYCKLCRRSFICSSQLKVHMRSHTGEKPYSCSFCGKTFCTTSSRNKHVRIHADEKLSSGDVREFSESVVN
ncbi:zinc finger protein 135-like [Mastacembelus armatus]|uniref:zinc finger protein 135-like n=1 Tax=Mastacembelus armatus TaxID=205130 RepID=UPI000F39ADC8|nr:zinc finger protein 135-like [Mastacembelus armatus]